jgi:hypothetical protein
VLRRYARLNQFHLPEPDHDARRFASADFGLLGLRSFRCGALGTIDALMATSRNVARPDLSCGSFTTGWHEHKVGRCPLCPDSDQIPHRSEITRCARTGRHAILCRRLMDPLNYLPVPVTLVWSRNAAEIGRVQLFSTCHALLGSGRLYSCTTSAKIAHQPRPNAANHDMLSLKHWDNVPSP